MRKTLAAALLVIPALLLSAFGASANPPDRVEFTESRVYPVAQCDGFEVINYSDFDVRLTFFYGSEGSLIRVNQFLSGVDVLTNSATGQSISASFHNHAVFDESDYTAHQDGVFWRFTRPGEGLVYFMAGQFSGEYNQPDATISFSGVSNLDVDALCSTLDS